MQLPHIHLHSGRWCGDYSSKARVPTRARPLAVLTGGLCDFTQFLSERTPRENVMATSFEINTYTKFMFPSLWTLSIIVGKTATLNNITDKKINLFLFRR
jgi:hypothetical protein